MARKKVERIRIGGMISENTVEKKDLEFVKNRLKSMSKSDLVREAIEVYRKHHEGVLLLESLSKMGLIDADQIKDINLSDMSENDKQSLKDSLSEKDKEITNRLGDAIISSDFM